MSIHFSRSLRRIQADGSRRSLLLVGLLVAVLGLWAAWFSGARVSVYATTAAARLEVDRENHPIDAPVGGRVRALGVAAGSIVKAGDVLLELDASPERLAQTEARARLEPSAHQIASLREELAAEQRALEGERRSGQAAEAESQARVDETASAADLASEEARRLATLRSGGLVSEMEAIRGQKLAEARRDAARSAEFGARKLERDLSVRRENRLARIARLKNEIAEVEGTRSEASAASDRLTFEIDQRLIRAPISGTLAELAPIKVGGVVAQGQRICTIVPDGSLKVVALFAPAVALGRVRTGQAARVRLEGFPWTTFGSAPAHVARVAGELRDGQVRVELTLDPTTDSSIPFQHGLPAEVDVEVEAVSPLAMVVRSVGSRMRVSAATLPPATR